MYLLNRITLFVGYEIMLNLLFKIIYLLFVFPYFLIFFLFVEIFFIILFVIPSKWQGIQFFESLASNS